MANGVWFRTNPIWEKHRSTSCSMLYRSTSQMSWLITTFYANVISGRLGKTCDLGRKKAFQSLWYFWAEYHRSFSRHDAYPVMGSRENMGSIWWRNDCSVFEIGRIIWRDFRRSENNRDCIVWAALVRQPTSNPLFHPLPQSDSTSVFNLVVFTIPNTKYQVPNAKYQIPSAKYQVPNTKYQISSTKCRVPNAKY